MVCASSNQSRRSASVEELAKQRLSTGCPYAFYFRNVECDFAKGVLTLRGRVPTFYLKQVLQARLADLHAVVEIRNQVDVISSTGLSSVRQS
jgi:hypothetical protein